MWGLIRIGIRFASLGVLAAMIVVSLVSCEGSTAGTSGKTYPVPESIYLPLPAAEDDIAATYVRFMDATQTVADRAGLLENGQQYTKELEALGASLQGGTVALSLSSVTVTAPTAAEVHYSVFVGEQPAFTEQVGKAVLQNGVWKVGADSFLAMLALLQGAATPAS